jgi:hypothetical protein
MTTFLAGDQLTRRLTAKDANRMLRAAQEHEAGLANVTAKDVLRVWQNGHILVRNDATGGPANRYCILGYANSPTLVEPNLANVDPQLFFFIGQDFRPYKHFFRHCVLQQRAVAGEVVPAAVSGITFAQVFEPLESPTTFATGGHLAINYSSSAIGPTYFSQSLNESFQFGHATLVKAPCNSPLFQVRSTALVMLRQFTPVWRATIDTRVDQRNYTGKLTAYATSESGVTINIRDPLKIVPSSMTSAEIGSITAGIQLCQPNLTGTDPAALPNIEGCFVTLDNYSMVRFVSVTP